MPVWCQDEAGPYQAIPQEGAGWHPEERPACQPHEYIRGGTAKLLTLFHPATGAVRVKGVTSAPNAVLHPWLQAELGDILAACPPSPPPPLPADHPLRRHWERWGSWLAGAPLPPLRLILVWDNLIGHTSAALLRWLAGHGVLPLYTPLSGSWLNMAESVQRIIVRRALAGQEPATSDDLIGWLEETADGWNADPTPFVWDGKRRERRRRARARRLGGSAAIANQFHLNVA
ncbi:MAG: transposase [Chloroflexota bacterium]|nr:transposase [Chloroflexota bacterium]